MTGPKLNEAPVRMRQGAKRGLADQSTKATARWVRTSAWKMREVVDLIRGHSVEEAANILRFCERDPATVIAKVLASAVANAEANDSMSADELYVSACFVDEGPTVKRFMPRARGRADRINKRSSHITVVVSRMPDDQLAKARSKSAAVAANRARRTAGQRAAGEQTAGAERRAASGTVESVAGATIDSGAVSAAEALPATEAGELAAEGLPATQVGELAAEALPATQAGELAAEALPATQAGELAAEAIEATETVPTNLVALFDRPEGDGDEINKIIGIGPKIKESLNELGITTFAQIAGWTDEDIERIDAVLPRSAEQLSDWRTQAQEILAGTWNRDTTNNT